MARRAGRALWADLFINGIDLGAVLDGRGPHSPALALAVAEGLPDTSRTAAALLGDEQAHGWGADRELLTNMNNLLIELLRNVPDWKKRPEIAHLETPAARARAKYEAEKKRESLSTNRGVLSMFGM